MNLFSMPADFSAATIDRYAELNRAHPDRKVAHTYGNITVSNPLGSGRNINKLPTAGIEQVAAYTAYSNSRGIEFHYTLNASYLQNREFTGDGVREIRRFLDLLHEAGVRMLIIAMPSLMELVRSMGDKFQFKASAICQITSPNKALLFKNLGASAMVVDETINREFDTLRRIRDVFGGDVQVIVNSICHQDCQFRMFHYNQISGDSAGAFNEVSGSYFPLRCGMRLHEDLSNCFKTTWIRPEDLHYYREIGIRSFKLQGRQWVLKGDPVRTVESYFKEHYDGDLKNLLFMFAPADQFRLHVDNRLLDGFLKPFVDHPGFCRRDCSTCDYCEQWAQKCFGDETVRKAALATVAFIRQHDPYSRLIAD